MGRRVIPCTPTSKNPLIVRKSTGGSWRGGRNMNRAARRVHGLAKIVRRVGQRQLDDIGAKLASARDLFSNVFANHVRDHRYAATAALFGDPP